MSSGPTDGSRTHPRTIAIIGPVFPYRAGIAYCTTRLAEELGRQREVVVSSFRRQFPKRFYPGGDDIDPTLAERRPPGARFELDVINPLSWIHEGLRLRREGHESVVFVWWVWVWALPYLVMMALQPSATRIVLQCHNITDKEPARWKSWLTNRVLRRGDALVVHARTEAAEARRRVRHPERVVETFLPVHELGGSVPTRESARERYDLGERRVVLFFGHVRPFKALDVALRAVAASGGDWTLFVAGEVWWNDERTYRALIDELGIEQRVRLELRYVPDAEVAWVFAACDLVVAPYRREAQSGVALTAFHFEKPVVASNVGGLPEIVRDGVNGAIVPPDDPVSLAGAIDRIFVDGRIDALTAGARAAARTYSWSRYGEVIASVLQGIR